jgi:hypothetical protein
MKFKYLSVFVLLVISNSCINLNYKNMDSSDYQLITTVGEIKTTIVTLQPLHIPINIKNRIYNNLLDKARTQYSSEYNIEHIDVRNIRTISGTSTDYSDWLTYSAITMVGIPLTVVTAVLFNQQDIYATGTVVIDPNKNIRIRTKSANEIEKLLGNAANDISGRLPENSIIVILNILNAPNAENLINELEFQFIRSDKKFHIVERRRLDLIRQEQQLQLSGEISDNSAVSIGRWLGANIVITGEIVNVNRNQVLTLKAIDVETAQIVGMTRINW